jgi:hypothetical protein
LDPDLDGDGLTASQEDEIGPERSGHRRRRVWRR